MEFSFGGFVMPLLATIVIVGLVFLICREVACWYFKINDILNQQKKTNLLLERIAAALEEGEEISCPECRSSKYTIETQNGTDKYTCGKCKYKWMYVDDEDAA